MVTTMVSRLEDLLLRGNIKNGDLRGKILLLLNHDDGKTLRSLRCVSQVFRDLIDHHPSRTFRFLYLTLPLTEGDRLDELDVLASFCQTLIITIQDRAAQNITGSSRSSTSSTSLREKAKRASLRALRKSSLLVSREGQSTKPSPTSPALPSREDLHSSLSTFLKTEINSQLLLSLLPNFTTLQTIQIRLPDSSTPPWPGQTLREKTLLSLRTTLETISSTRTSPLRHLQKLTLSPIHFHGLLHLNWSGLSTFSITSPPVHNSTAQPNIWQNLTTLSISMFNPFSPSTGTLLPAREKMIRRLLYTYLESFSPTIKSLTFIWLHPSPPSLSSTPTKKSKRFSAPTSSSSPPSPSPSPPSINGMNDNEYPSPLLLHLSPKSDLTHRHSPSSTITSSINTTGSRIQDQRPLYFPKLLLLKLGNISPTHLLQTIPVLEEVAPRLEKFLIRDTLNDSDAEIGGDGKRRGWRGGGKGNDEEKKSGGEARGRDDEWVEIHIHAPPPPREGRGYEGMRGEKGWSIPSMMRRSPASSVYSRDANAAFLTNRGRDSQGRRMPAMMIDGNGNTWI